MKKGIVLLLALTVFLAEMTFAKKLEGDAVRNNKSAVGNSKWSLGFGMEVADFYSPYYKKLQTFKSPVAFGPRIGFWRNFNSSIALGLDLASYAFSTKTDATSSYAPNQYNLLYAGTAAYKFNNGYILKENCAFAPYIFAKLQGSWAEENITKQNLNGFGIPIGAGINWKIANNVALNTYGGYNFGIKNNEDHIFFGAGLMVDLGKGDEVEEPKVEEPVVLVDTDGDGIADLDDACPTVAGLEQFNGCPDSDGDGIQDSEDECPEVPGVAEFNGCPDSDGDGVPDYKDACPNVKGEARFGGCPNPDSDGDGVVDAKDKCPTVPGPIESLGCPDDDRDKDGIKNSDDKCPDKYGPASNDGCPIDDVIMSLNADFKNIRFNTNSSTLTSESMSIIENAAKVMNSKLSGSSFYIDGHTDTRGAASYNKTLSKNRAQEVVNQLVKLGVSKDRLTSRGFGEEQPKCAEDTEEGLWCNRRVEIVIRNVNQTIEKKIGN
ncbi:MAG: OmpA family protein [Chitinophagales bacterium]|nr:OmpA family protein [Chitinophagales bacterium]